jgi:hypothetical protein
MLVEDWASASLAALDVISLKNSAGNGISSAYNVRGMDKRHAR